MGGGGNTKYRSFIGWQRIPYKKELVKINAKYKNRKSFNESISNSTWFFGGSTMWGTGSSDNDTIPSFYAKKTKSKVFNFGETGWTSRQSLNQLINIIGIKEVSKDDFLNNDFDEAVFVHLNTMDYNTRIDGKEGSKSDFYSNPKSYKSDFMKFAKQAEFFIAGHYHAADSPFLFTRDDAKSKDFKIRTVADISCDINGPVASTIRCSTITDPIYGYNPDTEKEDDFRKQDVITVMAVDNLPCELPKDASEGFGQNLLTYIIPNLLGNDLDNVIEKATICENGKLKNRYKYLESYVMNDDNFF